MAAAMLSGGCGNEPLLAPRAEVGQETVRAGFVGAAAMPLHVRYEESGAALAAEPNAREPLRLGAEAVGRDGDLDPLPMGTPRSEAGRTIYRRGSILEWFEEGPQGLEHGLIIERRPAGGGALEIRLRQDPNFRTLLEHRSG